MKRILLNVVAVLATANFATAQCTDIFISEYVEGTNNNKAIEIYNPTANTISLAGNYRLVRYNNGTAAATAEADNAFIVSLGNYSITSYSTFVYIIDKRDPAGTGNEIQIDAALKTKGDALLAQTPQAAAYICPVYTTSSAIYQNGNDALSIQKWNGTAWVYVDIFACIGECPIGYSSEASMTLGTCNSPSSGWTDLAPYAEPPAGYNTAAPPTGDGFYFKRVWTADHTLSRKASVKQGTTVNPALKTWNPSTQWDSLPQNTFSNLGSHTCDCNPNSIKNDLKASTNQLDVYPVPANDQLNIASDAAFSTITISNVVGQSITSVSSDELKGRNNYSITTSSLEAGVYFVNVVFQDKTTSNRKIIINK